VKILRQLFLPVVLFFCLRTVQAQKVRDMPDSVVYKNTPAGSLSMYVLYPPGIKKVNKCPCIVFFFGGGWIRGSINQFRYQADYFRKRGLVCFLVDYRVESRQKSTPFQSLEDAKSSIRFIRKNADVFHIYKDSLIACGASAGGQLAAATAVIKGYNDPNDDTAFNAKPNILVLFNPVIDNGPAGYGYDRIGEAYKSFSPLHNIKRGAPPTIIFLGTKDHFIPVATMEYYKTEMEKAGSRCDLILYNDVGHGFFNKGGFRETTLFQADQFLVSLGYLEGDG
jgi:acetyl esterase/lipase